MSESIGLNAGAIIDAMSNLPVESLAAAGEQLSTCQQRLTEVSTGAADLDAIAGTLAESAKKLDIGQHLLASVRDNLSSYLVRIGYDPQSMAEVQGLTADLPGDAEQKTSSSYGGTTDPALHSHGRFRYMVHAINPAALTGVAIIQNTSREMGVEYDPEWGDQSVQAFDRPERMHERVSVSMSLIDQDHTDTWGDGGLIMDVPAGNVVITSPQDAGVDNRNRPELLAAKSKTAPMTGDKLLAGSEEHSYNEVVALGTHEEQQVRTVGFFIKVTEWLRPYDAALAERLRLHAERLGLPLIEIIKPTPFRERAAEKNSDTSSSVHFGGWRFNLYYGETSGMGAINELMRIRFPSPQRVGGALDYGVRHGVLTRDQAERVGQAYEARIEERRTPKPVYGDDGRLIHVKCTVGYEDKERQFIICQGGASVSNMIMQAEQARYASRYSARDQESSGSRIPLTAEQADMIIERACAALGAEESSRVRAWYDSIRESIDRAHDYAQLKRRSVLMEGPPCVKDRSFVDLEASLKAYSAFFQPDPDDPFAFLTSAIPRVV